MKKSRIIIALIAVLIIAAFILLRGPVNNIFGAQSDESVEKDAKARLAAAEQDLKSAENAVQNDERQVSEDKENLDAALKERDDAEAALADLGYSQSELDALAGETEAPILRVEAIHSSSEDIASGVSVSGQVEASRKLEVRAETSGQVISEPIPSGAAVTKDQVLCELDPGTSQAALDQALASYETAKTQYASTLSLKNRGLASTSALQNANASLEQASSAVDNAKKAIERLTIKAPFDGVLENQTAELGELLQPGSICASIIALDRLLLVGYVSENQVDKIQIGADAVGQLRDDRILRGKVSFVAATADPATRTYRTEISVDQSQDVRDGASARISIALAGVKGHLIPQNALTLDDNGALGVKIENNGRAEFVEINMVRDTPDGIWITGLPDEANVIIEGQEYAVEGQEVEAVFSDEAS